MKTTLKITGALLLALLVVLTCVYLWASLTTTRIFATTYLAHSVDFPIPFPAGDASLDAPDLALEQAVARGQHLISSRYPCAECHGADFGGGVMADAFPLGRLLGPNLTLGTGSRTRDYTAKDWDLTVRHGILPNGRPSVMPSEDFEKMTDQELADIVAYIREQPAVDNTVPPSAFGPLGNILVATGRLAPSVVRIENHTGSHAVYPPPALADSTFGAHIAAICTGCHGANLAGGAIAAGDPGWPPARNLTPDTTGIGGWTQEDFVAAMQDGVRPGGVAMKAPMTLLMPYAQRMTPVELEALWIYLQSLPPVANLIP